MAKSKPIEIIDGQFSAADRHRVACRMLRHAGHLDQKLPGQRRGESPIDWLVRLGLAPSPQVAAEMLILGQGLLPALDHLAPVTTPKPP